MPFYWKLLICVNSNGYEQHINIKWLLAIVSAAIPASKDNPSILYKFTKQTKAKFLFSFLNIRPIIANTNNRQISHNCHYGDISLISHRLRQMVKRSLSADFLFNSNNQTLNKSARTVCLTTITQICTYFVIFLPSFWVYCHTIDTIVYV